ncbi:MAG: class B sortase [Clostridiales bacterium]|nr:class B sortase [Clostridiales bacterium]
MSKIFQKIRTWFSDKKVLICVRVFFILLLLVSASGIAYERIMASRNENTWDDIIGQVQITRPPITIPQTTPSSTPSPTLIPTVAPTPIPTVEPTPMQSLLPSATPEPTPEVTVTPEPTPVPTPEPTPTPIPTPDVSVEDLYASLRQQNEDMIGWVSVDGTKINYPVMHTKSDIHYYLYKDFYGKYSAYGVPYVYGSYDLGEVDNIVLYGHHMKNGSMFSNLIHYQRKKYNYWASHRYVNFDTFELGYGTYEIFAVINAKANNANDSTNYRYFSEKVEFESKEDFDAFIKEVKRRDLFDTGITPQYGDDLLTLVTCEFTHKNGRLVVLARKVQ